MAKMVATVIITYEADISDNWGKSDQADLLRKKVQMCLNGDEAVVDDVTVETDEEYMSRISG